MKNAGVQNGLYMGIALVVLSLVMYLFDARFMLTWGSMTGWLVYILFMVKAAKDEREQLGGYASFKEILKSSFLSFVIGSGIAAIFAYILFNFIDPSLNDLVKDIQLEAMDKVADFLGEDAAEEAREKLKEDEGGMDFKKLLMGYSVGLIFPGIIIALITAAFLKREKPMV